MFLSQDFSIQCVCIDQCVRGEKGKVKKGLWHFASIHFNPSFFTVLAKTTDKNINIKTLTATTFTTETVTKSIDCHQRRSHSPPAGIALFPSCPFFNFVQSFSCIPFLTCYFYSSRTSHRSTASQDGQHTNLKNTIRTRDRHKGDIIIIIVVTWRGATRTVMGLSVKDEERIRGRNDGRRGTEVGWTGGILASVT